MTTIKKSLTIGQKIKKARKEAGMSQEDLGRALGLTDKAVSTYEVGRASPSIDTLKEISKVTYKPITYFMSDGDPDDINLEVKMKIIERELTEIKEILRRKSKKPTA